MDDVIADGDDGLAVPDNGSHILGQGHPASIDSFHILGGGVQYLGNLLDGAVDTAQCLQHHLEGVVDRADKAGLLNVHIIVIQLIDQICQVNSLEINQLGPCCCCLLALEEDTDQFNYWQLPIEVLLIACC